MRSTLYACFANPAEAEKATGALLDHGLHPEDISLLAHESYEEVRKGEIAAAAYDPDYQRRIDEVEAKEYTGTSVGFAGANTTGRSIFQPEGGSGSNIGYGAEMAGGIESTDVATHYPGGDHAMVTESGAQVMNEEAVPVVINDPLKPENLAAKTGITTTTATDAGAGALTGTAVGVGVGLLATLAALFIPGIGIVVGAGALATAAAGTAAAGAAGAVAGGAIGFLKDQGVPEEAITVYRTAYDNGGAVLAVDVPADKNKSDIEAILAKYGAQNLEMYGQVKSVL